MLNFHLRWFELRATVCDFITWWGRICFIYIYWGQVRYWPQMFYSFIFIYQYIKPPLIGPFRAWSQLSLCLILARRISVHENISTLWSHCQSVNQFEYNLSSNINTRCVPLWCGLKCTVVTTHKGKVTMTFFYSYNTVGYS